MKHINLLPPHVEQYKKNRAMYIKMAAAQAAILLLTVLIVLYVNAIERRVATNMQEVLACLATRDEAPLLLAEELERVRELTRQLDVFYASNFPGMFEVQWFEAIINAAPPQASVLRLDYSQQEVMLVGEVPDARYVEIHRQAILGSGFFDHAWLGGIDLLECGHFSYVLRIGVIVDE